MDKPNILQQWDRVLNTALDEGASGLQIKVRQADQSCDCSILRNASWLPLPIETTAKDAMRVVDALYNVCADAPSVAAAFAFDPAHSSTWAMRYGDTPSDMACAWDHHERRLTALWYDGAVPEAVVINLANAIPARFREWVVSVSAGQDQRQWVYESMRKAPDPYFGILKVEQGNLFVASGVDKDSVRAILAAHLRVWWRGNERRDSIAVPAFRLVDLC